MESGLARWLIRLGTIFGMVFLYVPILVVVLYAFNPSVAQAWPMPGLTTKWFSAAWHNEQVRDAFFTSIKAASGATLLALTLGSLAAFAVHRFKWFGRESVSFVLVLPIALPGIVTGMALNAAINTAAVPFSLWTIILGHTTFCIVVVYNNVVARLRRSPTSHIEASMDLGADGWQTFRYVTFPTIATALVAGALLAFALSFDEIIVTNFTSGAQLTLPKWIYNNLRLPRNRPIVNVVAMAVIVLSIIPVYFANRLAGGSDATGRARVEEVPGL